MILVLDPDLNKQKQNDICLKLQKEGFFTRLVSQYGRLIIALDGSMTEKFAQKVAAWTGIKEVLRGRNPYFLASRRCNSANSEIKVGDAENIVAFGGDNVVCIAGPCAIETEEEALKLAHELKNMGAEIFRAMIFKPRSSPYSFQGLGRSGLPILKKIKQETGMLLLTEVREPLEAELVQDIADIIQVGTRNMSNFQLLKHLGQLNKPVLLKRGMGATVEELLCAAEYILAHGNPDVILCERGIRTFEHYTRFSLDIGAIPAIKELSHLPVIVDPSHASGKSSLVKPLAMAGIAAGADGLMVEVHPEPCRAFSDGIQSVKPEEFKDMFKNVAQIARAVGRKVKERPQLS
ncbi:MAG: 3-deoxy-7-phosphoheptulonate synthase [Candidatus Rifleibacteriota bacterium]